MTILRLLISKSLTLGYLFLNFIQLHLENCITSSWKLKITYYSVWQLYLENWEIRNLFLKHHCYVYCILYSLYRLRWNMLFENINWVKGVVASFCEEHIIFVFFLFVPMYCTPVLCHFNNPIYKMSWKAPLTIFKTSS